MEQMRKDLGYEMVYDFIGDRLEEKQVDLHSLMQRAIMERESLNELMDQFEETISEEYQSLIELAKQEQLAADTIDLPGLKRNQDKVIARKVPPRVYFNFNVSTLEQHRVRTYESHNGKVMRVEREV
jgi:hypothetical protein